MIRRIIGLILILLPTLALAEPQTWHLQANRRCQVIDFTAEVPEALAGALDGTPLAQDEILCGCLLTHMTDAPPRVESRTALLALRHGDNTLLVWCSRKSGEGWTTEVIAEHFLDGAGDYTITAVPWHGPRGYLTGNVYGVPGSALPAVVCGGRTYLIGGRDLFMCLPEDGQTAIGTGGADGLLCIYTIENGDLRENVLPGYGTLRLSEVRAAEFPATLAQAEAWCAARPFPEGTDALSSGVNLRAEPARSARLIGWCSRGALLEILATSPDGAWYQVRSGEVTGWANHNYVHRAGDYFSAVCADEGLTVARTDRAVEMRSAPGSGDRIPLPGGTLMHVLGKIDGYLHVSVPERIGHHPDPAGTTGYLREQDVTQAETFLLLKYR